MTIYQEIIEKELSIAVLSMAKGKTHGHDGIQVEFFSKVLAIYWTQFS